MQATHECLLTSYLDKLVEDIDALGLRLVQIIAQCHAPGGSRDLVQSFLHGLLRHLLVSPVFVVVAEAVVLEGKNERFNIMFSRTEGYNR